MSIGFTYFNIVTQVVKPTTVELLASLTGAQKTAILNGFVKKIIPKTLSYSTGINRSVIRHLYQAIDAIEERAKILMRGEVIITPAEYDKDGNEIKPAEYNESPSTSTALGNQIKDDFSGEFTGGQVTAILAKMVKFSKFAGDGNWEFYKNNIIL